MAEIIFTNTSDVPDEYAPKPASFFVPDWYKDIESYVGGVKKPSGDGVTTGTIKRCMPVFDSIVSGYIIPTYVDVFVTQRETKDSDGNLTGVKLPWYEWPIYKPIEWHHTNQASNHPYRGDLPDGGAYPKWINHWSIQTPPGYSCLFIQPTHRPSPFNILPGVVDTDTYTPPVNFPFVLNDWGFEGLIPAGTPMVQVIPFKRDSWEMKLGTREDLVKQNKTKILLRTRFFDSYKSQFRQVKEYK